MTQQRKADPPTMAEILEWATIQHNAVAERARTAVAAEKVHKTKAAERNALAVVRELVVIRGLLDLLDVLDENRKQQRGTIVRRNEVKPS
jgi:hypothetical protein